MVLLMRLLVLIVGGLVMLSLVLVVICLGSVVAGTQLFLTFIGSSLPFLGLWSIMMVTIGTAPDAPVVVCWCPPQEASAGSRLFWIGHFCLGLLVSGARIGLMCLLLLFLLKTLLIGPNTPSLLVKWVTFFGTLHCPAGGFDLGVGGVSHVELLILYERWACERLSFEKAHPRYLRPGAFQFQCRLLLLVQALIFGALVVFVGAMMRSLLFAAWWAW